MSLKLHQDCRRRLSEKIAEHLPQARVRNRMFLERKSIGMLYSVEKTLPETGVLREQLEDYISESPVFDFIYETLSRELHETQKYDLESPDSSLTEIQGYEDPGAIAERLVREFESLPWAYSLSIKCDNDFGEFFSKTIKSHSIGTTTKIFTPDEAHVVAFPLKSGIEGRDLSLTGFMGLLSIGTLSWDPSATYLEVNVTGFIGMYGETAALERAISFLKAFCGIGIALRLFKVNYTYRPTPTKAKFVVHRSIAGAWQIEGTHELDASVSDTFHDLILNDLDGHLDDEPRKVAWMQSKLDEVACVFKNEERAKKLLLASQWLFDSYCGKNELLSFVQTAVVMEILLGEKSISDLMGLGELLRNRCAYLIGKSHKQREMILNEFKEIYDVRSKIIHRGKSRLNIRERALFSTLQWMCRRVIQEEVELLKKDLEQNA